MHASEGREGGRGGKGRGKNTRVRSIVWTRSSSYVRKSAVSSTMASPNLVAVPPQARRQTYSPKRHLLLPLTFARYLPHTRRSPFSSRGPSSPYEKVTPAGSHERILYAPSSELALYKSPLEKSVRGCGRHSRHIRGGNTEFCVRCTLEKVEEGEGGGREKRKRGRSWN